MKERKRKILVPQYIHGFSCIGSACGANCCEAGWNIFIDHETYKKYKKIRDPELTPLINDHVKRNRAKPDEWNYAKINLLKGGVCPFLNNDKICRLQEKFGPDYLCNVCHTYPRFSNLVNGVLEKSATVSCPEAGRLVLLNPDGIDFDETGEGYEVLNIINRKINTHDKALANKPEKYLWELRIFTISVLQDRKYSLWERLILLGLFYKKLQEYIDDKRIEDIPGLIASYSNIADDGSLRGDFASIPAQTFIQMELTKELADQRFSMGLSIRQYVECFGEFLDGIKYVPEAKPDELAQRYNEAYADYYKPFMDEREYVLENYLVNYVFKNLFPFTGEKSVFEAYMTMILHYSLIKMLLIGMGAHHGGLTEELVIKLVQAFSVTIEHHQLFMRRALEFICKSGYNTMAYMAILIKN